MLGIIPTGYLCGRFHEDPYSDLSPTEQPTILEMQRLYSHFYAKCLSVAQAHWNHVLYRRLTPSSLVMRAQTLDAIRTDWICNLYMTEAATRLRLLGATAGELSRLYG